MKSPINNQITNEIVNETKMNEFMLLIDGQYDKIIPKEELKLILEHHKYNLSSAARDLRERYNEKSYPFHKDDIINTPNNININNSSNNNNNNNLSNERKRMYPNHLINSSNLHNNNNNNNDNNNEKTLSKYSLFVTTSSFLENKNKNIIENPQDAAEYEEILNDFIEESSSQKKKIKINDNNSVNNLKNNNENVDLVKNLFSTNKNFIKEETNNSTENNLKIDSNHDSDTDSSEYNDTNNTMDDTPKREKTRILKKEHRSIHLSKDIELKNKNREEAKCIILSVIIARIKQDALNNDWISNIIKLLLNHSSVYLIPDVMKHFDEVCAALATVQDALDKIYNNKNYKKVINAEKQDEQVNLNDENQIDKCIELILDIISCLPDDDLRKELISSVIPSKETSERLEEKAFDALKKFTNNQTNGHENPVLLKMITKNLLCHLKQCYFFDNYDNILKNKINIITHNISSINERITKKKNLIKTNGELNSNKKIEIISEREKYNKKIEVFISRRYRDLLSLNDSAATARTQATIDVLNNVDNSSVLNEILSNLQFSKRKLFYYYETEKKYSYLENLYDRLKMFYDVVTKKNKNYLNDVILTGFNKESQEKKTLFYSAIYGYIPTIVTLLLGIISYESKKCNKANELLIGYNNELSTHLELFKDECKQRENDIIVRIKEMQNIIDQSQEKLASIFKIQINLWKSLVKYIVESMDKMSMKESKDTTTGEINKENDIFQFLRIQYKKMWNAFDPNIQKEFEDCSLDIFGSLDELNHLNVYCEEDNFQNDKKLFLMKEDMDLFKTSFIGGQALNKLQGEGKNENSLELIKSYEKSGILAKQMHQGCEMTKVYIKPEKISYQPGDILFTRFNINNMIKYVQGVVISVVEEYKLYKMRFNNGDVYTINRIYLVSSPPLNATFAENPPITNETADNEEIHNNKYYEIEMKKEDGLESKKEGNCCIQ